MSKQRVILVVCSQEVTAKLLCMMLEKQGFHVILVRTVDEANEGVDMRSVDVLVLDMVHSHSSGVTAIEDIRRTSTMPIIVLSTVSRRALICQALEAGASAFITKPFAAKSLFAKIRQALLPQISNMDALR